MRLSVPATCSGDKPCCRPSLTLHHSELPTTSLRSTRGWKTADKKPVKNEDLWRRLDELAGKHHVQWVWIKGHAGHDGNERADQLANRGIEQLLGK